MSNKDLQVKPHKISGTEDAWWYEEEYGIAVVQEYMNIKDEYVGTCSTLIKWSSIRAALERKDKP